MGSFMGRFQHMTVINRWAEEDLREWTSNMEETFEQGKYSSNGGLDQEWDDDPRHTYVDDSDESDDIDDEDSGWGDFNEYDDDDDWDDDEDDSDDEGDDVSWR